MDAEEEVDLDESFAVLLSEAEKATEYFGSLCMFTNKLFSIITLISLLQFFQLKNNKNSLFSFELPQHLTLYLNLLVLKKNCLGRQQSNGHDQSNCALKLGISSYIKISVVHYTSYVSFVHLVTLNIFFFSRWRSYSTWWRNPRLVFNSFHDTCNYYIQISYSAFHSV